MSNESEVADEIYVAPETSLDAKGLEICKSLAIYYENFHNTKKAEINKEIGGVYPEIEAASALGMVVALHHTLESVRSVLVESIDDRPELNDVLLQLGSTVSANSSIITQLYNVLLNVFEVQQMILETPENMEACIDTVERLVIKSGHEFIRPEDRLERALEDAFKDIPND